MSTDVLPILAGGPLDTVFKAVEVGPIRDWPEETVEVAVAQCRQALNAIRVARRRYTEMLRVGTDAKAFMVGIEPFLRTLRLAPGRSSQLAEQLSGQVLDEPMKEFVSAFEAMTTEAADLLGFLEAAWDTAKTPARPINWDRVQQAEEAFARGETRPFRGDIAAPSKK